MAKLSVRERLLFQSTHSHGVRSHTFPITLIALEFQSTHSHGVRSGAEYIVERIRYFNPRTHMECDRKQIEHREFFEHFNPRTHMECDTGRGTNPVAGVISIHALTWSAIELTGIEDTFATFQSTHSHGVRYRTRGQGRAPVRISIHALTWSAMT